VTNLQRAHLVLALGVLNLFLAGMGLAVSNVGRAGASATGQQASVGEAQAPPRESLASPTGTTGTISTRPPQVAVGATPRSSPASSVEPSAPPTVPVAGLASPPPSPQASEPEVLGKRALTGDGSGLITVTPGRPVASVTVTVRASRAVSAAQADGSLSVHLEGVLRRAARAGDMPTPLVAAITRLGSTAKALSWSARPELEDRLASGCPSGDCVQSYRIVVALVDPAVKTATFAWTAEASAVLDRGTFPKGARLTVKATHAASIRRAATALDGLAVQRAQLDADHKLVVREVMIDLPAGLDREELAGVLVRATVNAKNVQMAVYLAGRRISSSGTGDLGPRLAFDPFAGCRTTSPCRLNLRVEFRRLGADTGARVTVAWALSAWAADPRPLARASGLTVELGGSPERSPKPEPTKDAGPTASKDG
jgi:hypothetical protein